MTEPSDLLPIASTTTVRRVAGELLRAERPRVVAATALLIGASAAGLVGPWAVGRIINAATGEGPPTSITVLGLVMVGALLVQAALGAAGTAVALRTGEDVLAGVRDRFVGSLLRLPLGRVERAGTGELVARTSDDIGAVSEVVRLGVPSVGLVALMIGATAVTAFVVSPVVSLGMLVSLSVIPVLRWYLRRSMPMWHEVGRGFSAVSEALGSNAAAARDIDLLGLGEPRRRAVDAAIGRLYRARRREIRLQATVLVPAVDLAFSVPLVVTLAWGGWLVSHGVATAGAVATVCLYISRLARPCMELLNWLDQFQRAGVSAARILGVDELVTDDGPVIAPADETLDLRQVCFSYRPGHPVLHEVSLEIRQGERLAIVGPSGSGKSTLARIMSGIDAPDSGAARIGGVELAGQPIQALRRTVALVTQENHVFAASLAENLRLANPTADDAALVRALDTVGWDFDGDLDTMIGSGGTDLSSLQGQQVALARLLLLDPAVVILDEATAQFDAGSLRAFDRAFSAALHGRTVIAIAHRLQTAIDADRVAVMIDGRLVQVGTPAELLARPGAFADLWRAAQTVGRPDPDSQNGGGS